MTANPKYPTKRIEVPDLDKCREQIRGWMADRQISYRELSKMTGIAASNLNAMVQGHRPLGVRSLERLFEVITK
jgi:transcriptional regulator with XRE-family HTH domain